MHIRLIKLFLIASLLIFPFSSFAESGPLGWGEKEFKQDMQTDRPDFTEGTQTVQAGHLQVESGYTYIEDKSGGVKEQVQTLPEALLRIGITETFEARVFWGGWIDEKTTVAGASTREDGVDDMSIGFKWCLIEEQDGWVPFLSLIGELGLPVGDKVFSSRRATGAAKLLWAYDLDDTFSLAGNFNIDYPRVNDTDYWEFQPSISLGAAITEEFGFYAEWFALVPIESKDVGVDTYYANGGFTYLLTSNVQFDIRAGWGLTSKSADLFAGAGITFRV